MVTLHLQRVVIYPAYIDVSRTVAGGRKICKQKGDWSVSHRCLLVHTQRAAQCQGKLCLVRAACDNPTALEIVDCCNMALKLVAELEVAMCALPCTLSMAGPGSSKESCHAHAGQGLPARLPA